MKTTTDQRDYLIDHIHKVIGTDSVSTETPGVVEYKSGFVKQVFCDTIMVCRIDSTWADVFKVAYTHHLRHKGEDLPLTTQVVDGDDVERLLMERKYHKPDEIDPTLLGDWVKYLDAKQGCEDRVSTDKGCVASNVNGTLHCADCEYGQVMQLWEERE